MVRCWVVSVLLLTSGCGMILGLEDPEAVDEPLQPTIGAIEPTADAVDVDRVAPVRVTFTTAMDAASLDDGALRVESADGEVTGTLSYDAASRTLSLQPAQPLAMRGSYTATLAATVRSDVGLQLGEARTWSFTVRDARWEEPKRLSPVGRYAGRLELSASSAGAIATWTSDGDQPFLAIRQGADGTWGDLEDILESSDDPNPVIMGPATVIDATGTATVVWSTFEQAMGIQRYPGSGWSVPRPIGPAGQNNFSFFKLAVDDNGAAVAMWSSSEGSVSRVYANRVIGSRWGNAEPIGDDIWGPALGMNHGGDAVAVWARHVLEGSVRSYGLDSVRVPLAGAVGAPVSLVPLRENIENGDHQVGVDDAGDAVAMWSEGTFATGYTLRAATLTGDTWSAPIAIENDAGEPRWPKLAVARDGTAMVVWTHSDGHVWATRYVPGVGWSPAAPIHPDAKTAPLSEPYVALDSHGDGVALFVALDDDEEQSLWSSRYVAGVGWSAPTPIEATPNRHGDSTVRVVLDDDGTGRVVWERSEDGDSAQIWASTFR